MLQSHGGNVQLLTNTCESKGRNDSSLARPSVKIIDTGASAESIYECVEENLSNSSVKYQPVSKLVSEVTMCSNLSRKTI